MMMWKMWAYKSLGGNISISQQKAKASILYILQIPCYIIEKCNLFSNERKQKLIFFKDVKNVEKTAEQYFLKHQGEPDGL